MNHFIGRGTTARLRWTLTTSAGKDAALENHTCRLYYSNGSSRSLATGIEVCGGTLTWTFTPDEGWKSGAYDFWLEVYTAGRKVCTIGYPQAMMLLDDPSPKQPGRGAVQDDVSTIEITSVVSEEVVSAASLENLLDALVLGGVIADYTMAFNPDTGEYDFTVTKA